MTGSERTWLRCEFFGVEVEEQDTASLALSIPFSSALIGYESHISHSDFRQVKFHVKR